MFLPWSSNTSSWSVELLRQFNSLQHYVNWIKKRVEINYVIKKKEKECLFNEIPVVDSSRRVYLYLVLLMLMIVEDHPFSQCQVYCDLLITFEKHD